MIDFIRRSVCRLSPDRRLFSTRRMDFRQMRLETAPTTVFQEKTVPAGTQTGRLGGARRTRSPSRRRSGGRAASRNSISAEASGEEGDWTVFDKRYWPGDTFADHLTFALRHEDIDLLILKRVFEAVPQAEIEALVRAAPTGIPARRAWYLYEILTGRTLDVDDAPRAAAIDLLDPKAYFTGKPRLLEAAPRPRQSAGHRPVLPGHPAHQDSDRIHGTRSRRQGARNRGPHRRASRRARRQLHAAGRQPGQFRDRGRAAAAQPAGAMGPRRPAGGQEPAHAR